MLERPGAGRLQRMPLTRLVGAGDGFSTPAVAAGRLAGRPRSGSAPGWRSLLAAPNRPT